MQDVSVADRLGKVASCSIQVIPEIVDVPLHIRSPGSDISIVIAWSPAHAAADSVGLHH